MRMADKSRNKSQMTQKQIAVNKHKSSFLYKCSLILIFLLAVSSLFSFFRAVPYMNQLWASFMLGWIVLTMIDSPKYIFQPTTYRLLVYFYVIYTVGIAYATNNSAIGNRFFELAQLPLFFIAYQKNKLIGGEKDNWLIISWVTPFVLFTSYMTIKKLLTDPWASRASSNTTENGLELLKIGVGGYHFIYFLVFVIAILLFFLFNKNQALKIQYKVIGVGILLMFTINIILANYTTALFLVCLAVLMRMIGSRLTNRNLLVYSAGFIFFVIFLSIILQSVLHFMAELFMGSSNSMRIQEVENYLFSNEIGISLGMRFDVFSDSIDAFFHNPFLGILKNNVVVSQGELSGFGNHSQILDTFALFGLGIGILQLYIYLHPLVTRIRQKNGTFSIFSLTIILLLCILFSINTATSSIGFAIYFIFPTAYDWLQNNNQLVLNKSKGIMESI